MALIVKDRVKESSTTTGTADFTLGGAAAGFQTFAVIGNSNTTYYAAVDQATGDWEVGIGTYSTTGPTLTRDTVLESSNSGSKVSFAAGSKDVFCTYPAERSVYLDAAGSAVSVLDIGTLGVSTANITTANITAGTVTTTPASGNDLVNKTYVDTLVASGIHFHQPVRVESPINLNATYNNGTAGVGATLTNAGTQVALVIDGITVATNDRVLVYEQTNETQNGIYVVTSVGSGSTNWVLTRASDADTYVINSADGLSEGSSVFVQQGTTGAGETYTCNTSGTITFGTTNITFAQISSAQIYSAGTGLTLSGTQFRITNTGTAGTYGSASSVPVFSTNAQGQVTSATPTAIAIAAAAVSGLAASATTDTTNAANITSGTLPTGRLNGSYTGITGVGTLTAGTWNASTIAATRGGTGLTSFVQGDLLYATSTTTIGSLADAVAGNALISGGVGGDPAWGKIGLGTHVSGTLPVGNGGTGATTLSGYVFGNGTGAFTASASIPNSATTATSANTASAIVARDASGNFSAGTITAALNGNATTATTAANVNNGTLTLGVSGTGLSGSATFTANQSGNSTFTVTSNATNANTVSTIVARDASGNFSAGTVTAALSGNATTATTLQTARTLTVGNTGKTFNGSANVSWSPAEIVNRSTAPLDTYASWGDGVQLSDTAYPAGAGSIVASLVFSSNRGIQLATNSAGENTPLQFRRIHSGQPNGLGAWQLLVDNSSTQTVGGVKTFSSTIVGSITGNAATATTLQTARTIGGVSFNGSANINLPGVNTAGNQNTTGTAANVTGTVAIANGGTGATTAAAARTNLGATTLGSNLFTITNPSAITFPRFNADNTVSSLNAADFRTAIGAGTSSTTGTVTSVGGTGTVSGLSLSGTVTTSGNLTLGGTLAVLPSNFASQTAKTVLAAPNAAAGVPTFRLLVASDIPTLNQNTTGTAAISTAATVTTSATASAFKVPFANTTVSTTGNYGLLQDSEATFTYNPSTNTLVAGTFSGALSGNATTATNANNIAIAADTASTGSFFVPYVSATTGNVAVRGTRLTVQPSTGNFTAAGTIAANSDERLKKDWAVLPAGFIERLAEVKSGTYTRIDTGVRQAGASAQDWKKLLPEVVTMGEDAQSTLSLGYGNAALVSAIELAKRVVDQEARIAKLEALVAQLTKGNAP